jgi:hypothetical protein
VIVIDRTDRAAWLARIEQSIKEYRAARGRERLRRAIKLWRASEAHQRLAGFKAPPDRIH